VAGPCATTWLSEGGKRGRGRRKQRMIEDIVESEKYEKMKRTAEDRTRWIGYGEVVVVVAVVTRHGFETTFAKAATSSNP